ncbi:glycosyltransferase [Microbacterium murale]|uniref:Glycosyltransferase involved in cell wall biosynthesis n=1 Tax=Microbacterium murale TaxID=1081040 RepID=A0ABU0PCB7_9MICO|nr:glycosyltransferase [Microbacterium murale]MDQ0644607.1 glycosyltransferase involved in cell wall biosynthesis [Microbacterium murale]
MNDLIVLSLERWDAVWRRNQHLIAGLVAADPMLRVLFVEPPDDPLHDLRGRRGPQFGTPLTPIGERLWTLRPVKWLPRRWDAGGDDRRARAIRRAAAQLGFTTPLLWVNDPAAAGIVALTGWRSLYDITDDWLSAARPAAELERIAAGEALLLNRADAVVACSPELVRRKSPQRDDIHLVPNGVDLEAYRAQASRPGIMPPAPVALYLGTLHDDRLDVELCVRVADELADRVRLVLAGPDLLSAADRDRLDAAGVLRLGSVARDDVPAFLQHADVLIVPHRVTTFTDSLDPIKLYEYRAAGRPVVSTAVAGFRDSADPRIRIAGGDDFAHAVGTALESSVPEGSASAADIDWSARVRQMGQILTSIR